MSDHVALMTALPTEPLNLDWQRAMGAQTITPVGFTAPPALNL